MRGGVGGSCVGCGAEADEERLEVDDAKEEVSEGAMELDRSDSDDLSNRLV